MNSSMISYFFGEKQLIFFLCIPVSRRSKILYNDNDNRYHLNSQLKGETFLVFIYKVYPLST